MIVKENPLSESMEKYLTTIFELQRRQTSVHSIDIAKYLGYSKASVCIAIKSLIGKGLVAMNDNKVITLTPRGQYIAQHSARKIILLKNYLSSVLGVRQETADIDARKMAYFMSEETIQKLH